MLSFNQRLATALAELEARQTAFMKNGQSWEGYQQSVGYFCALRDVRAECEAILKQMME